MMGMQLFNAVAEHKAQLLFLGPWIALFSSLIGVRIFFDKATEPFKRIHIRLVGLAIILSSLFFLSRDYATWSVFLTFFLLCAAFVMTKKPRVKKPLSSGNNMVRYAGLSVCLFGASSVVLGMGSGYAPSVSMGPSMWPAASKGPDISLLNRSAFRTTAPSYGEDIEFDVPKGANWPEGRYRKRVWGVPGDKILVEEYGMVINGKRFADCSKKSKMIVSSYPRVWFCEVFFPGKKEPRSFVWGDSNPEMYKAFREIVSAKELFVVGDNTVESSDSREFGPIKQAWVVGRYDNVKPTSEKWKSW